jgi:hypothetical protein
MPLSRHMRLLESLESDEIRETISSLGLFMNEI